ncbi:MAG TPA: hypothetical protein VMJ70_00455 [Candidatus Sulfotelmatobacter sp.]|nr:hypothetical protein [Candidatus Sulfotelmatobacter sp.]
MLLAVLVTPLATLAADLPRKPYLEGIPGEMEDLNRAYSESFLHSLKGPAQPSALPDVFGPGSVLKAGNLVMKVTNVGILGNPFTTSSDPAGQWPGQSQIQYLNAVALAVGGVEIVNGQLIRRVTYSTEWRPPSLDAEDKMYSAYEGIVGGNRYQDDDSDGQVDEDFLDGRDNDGDGRIDEDFNALGQQEYSCAMTDFSLQSVTANVREQHAPLGLRVEQRAWAYSLTSPNLTNFDVVEYKIINVSGNMIDSLYVGWLVDFDSGPVDASNFFLDDMDAPAYPQGAFMYDWTQGGQVRDNRSQFPHAPGLAVSDDSALCSRQTLRVNGFSIADDNGDDNKTVGVPSFLLFGYTVDPLGILGPRRVQFRAFRSFTAGTPYGQGGSPTIDQQRFEFMSSTENVETNPTDPHDGFITAPDNDQKGDQQQWCSVGPWLKVKNGQSITVTIGIAVDRGSIQLARAYRNAYDGYLNARDADRGQLGKTLLDEFPSLNTAFTAQLAYEGIWEHNAAFPEPDFHGRETAVRADPGQLFQMSEDCEEFQRTVLVTDRQYYWFDFDCDYCTGVWDYLIGSANPGDPSVGGTIHKFWNSSAPPPSPISDASITYNYSENPSRTVVPGGDNRATIAWDNLSEITPDPAPPNLFDFRGYKIWKVANWTRPVGSPGPAEDEWSLVGEFRWFNYYDTNGAPIDSNSVRVPDPAHPGQFIVKCPEVFVPAIGASREICLKRGDLWNQQTGEVIHPDTSLKCNPLSSGGCESKTSCIIPPGHTDCIQVTRDRYPVGRYKFVDTSVKNGFIYFYSVTAFDSTNAGQAESRRSAVEAEGIVPQSGTKTGKNVWVVPNPYRGYASIQQRSSSWDLTPNATDPTGTHIDFFGMPPGKWTLRIYTVAGDLVQTIHSDDPVNDSIRGPVTVGNTTYHGYNKQQDNPDDGQARWNLISRNGQDVVSGIYLFTVNSDQGIQRGKFVIIR